MGRVAATAAGSPPRHRFRIHPAPEPGAKTSPSGPRAESPAFGAGTVNVVSTEHVENPCGKRVDLSADVGEPPRVADCTMIAAPTGGPPRPDGPGARRRRGRDPTSVSEGPSPAMGGQPLARAGRADGDMARDTALDGLTRIHHRVSQPAAISTLILAIALPHPTPSRRRRRRDRGPGRPVIAGKRDRASGTPRDATAIDDAVAHPETGTPCRGLQAFRPRRHEDPRTRSRPRSDPIHRSCGNAVPRYHGRVPTSGPHRVALPEDRPLSCKNYTDTE